MANQRNGEHEDEGMLRRVAIVLSSLPAGVASELMGSMSPRSKEAVRRTIKSLSDIDPLERTRAFRAFKVSMEQHPRRTPSTATAQPNIHSSAQPNAHSSVTAPQWDGTTETQVDRGTPTAPAPNPGTARLSFLEQVDDSALMRMLGGEHPQTVAVVLASISPAKAGRILPRLDARTQTETLRRIGRLDSFPDEAIADIADLFQQRVSEQLEQANNLPGQSALNAILSAMPATSRPGATSPRTAVDAIDHRHGSATPAMNPTRPATVHPDLHRSDRAQRTSNFPSLEESEQALAQKLRVAEQTRDDSTEPYRPGGHSIGHRGNPSNQNLSPILGSTDSISKHLEQLSPADLCRSLGLVETRIAVLALCGLPNRTSNAALALLPKAAAKQVRQAMSSLQTLNLRDIDDAKEAIARASLTGSHHAVPVAA